MDGQDGNTGRWWRRFTGDHQDGRSGLRRRFQKSSRSQSSQPLIEQAGPSYSPLPPPPPPPPPAVRHSERPSTQSQDEGFDSAINETHAQRYAHEGFQGSTPFSVPTARIRYRQYTELPDLPEWPYTRTSELQSIDQRLESDFASNFSSQLVQTGPPRRTLRHTGNRSLYQKKNLQTYPEESMDWDTPLTQQVGSGKMLHRRLASRGKLRVEVRHVTSVLRMESPEEETSADEETQPAEKDNESPDVMRRTTLKRQLS